MLLQSGLARPGLCAVQNAAQRTFPTLWRPSFSLAKSHRAFATSSATPSSSTSAAQAQAAQHMAELAQLRRDIRPRDRLAPFVLGGPLFASGMWYTFEYFRERAEFDRLSKNWARPTEILPADFSETDYVALEMAPYQVTGEYMHDREMIVAHKFFDGRPGINIVTPLQRPSGDVVLVNRGWLPAGLEEQGSRPELLPTGQVTVYGRLRGSDKAAVEFNGRPVVSAVNIPVSNKWYWVEVPLMAKWTQSKAILLDSVLSEPAPAGGLPIEGLSEIANGEFYLRGAAALYLTGLGLGLACWWYMRSTIKAPIKVKPPSFTPFAPKTAAGAETNGAAKGKAPHGPGPKSPPV